jgi:hypothetical protein
VFGLGIIVGLPIWISVVALFEEMTGKRRNLAEGNYWDEDAE